MAEKRKLAKDWRTSYQNAEAKVTKIENQIKERLLELCRLYPDAEIGRKMRLNNHPIMLAKDILNELDYFNKPNDWLVFIEIIEKWLAAQHSHKQSLIKFDEPKDFIEYEDNGDNYEPPVRTDESQVLEIRLYCMHEGCNKYIKGKEGYNGMFSAETGQRCDLRNQGFKCVEHRDENNQS